jgi:DNA-binding NarL/FixJ family response regulator
MWRAALSSILLATTCNLNGYPMILVATRSTSLRDGLLMLLAAMAPERSSEHVDETTLFDRLGEVPVELVVLDAELFGRSAESMLRQIAARSPATRCLILAETVLQQAELKQLSAEEVLLQGTPAAEIANAIERLLDI